MHSPEIPSKWSFQNNKRLRFERLSCLDSREKSWLGKCGRRVVQVTWLIGHLMVIIIVIILVFSLHQQPYHGSVWTQRWWTKSLPLTILSFAYSVHKQVLCTVRKTNLESATFHTDNLSRSKENDITLDKQGAREINDTWVTDRPLEGNTRRKWTVKVNVARRCPRARLDRPFKYTNTIT